MNKLQITSKYTGTQGFYCCVYPDRATMEALLAYTENVRALQGIQEPAALLHATVMYSSELSIPLEQLPWLDRSARFGAKCKGFDWFGTPGDSLGAIVMELESPDLQAFHSALSKRVSHSFADYRPHVTLAYCDASNSKRCLDELHVKPFVGKLIFTAPVFEDVG